MNMISAGRKTWCQRIKAAIILEGVILLMAAFLLWEIRQEQGGKQLLPHRTGRSGGWILMCLMRRCARHMSVTWTHMEVKCISTGSTYFLMWQRKWRGVWRDSSVRTE